MASSCKGHQQETLVNQIFSSGLDFTLAQSLHVYVNGMEEMRSHSVTAAHFCCCTEKYDGDYSQAKLDAIESELRPVERPLAWPMVCSHTHDWTVCGVFTSGQRRR